MVRRILFFILLLGTWVQSASACQQAHAAPTLAHKAMEIAVPEDFAAIGGEHRCECPAAIQNTRSAVSESNKSLRVSCAAGAGVLLNQSNPPSVALAERNRASSFLARPSGRPPYLLVSHLRQ